MFLCKDISNTTIEVIEFAKLSSKPNFKLIHNFDYPVEAAKYCITMAAKYSLGKNHHFFTFNEKIPCYGVFASSPP